MPENLAPARDDEDMWQVCNHAAGRTSLVERLNAQVTEPVALEPARFKAAVVAALATCGRPARSTSVQGERCKGEGRSSLNIVS